MARGDRTCIVCGKDYVYCPNCQKGDPNETWRNIYCSEECRGIYKICNSFAFGHTTAEAAKKQLDKYHITDRSKYSEDVRKSLSAIYAAKTEAPKVEESALKSEATPKKEEESTTRVNRRRERKNDSE